MQVSSPLKLSVAISLMPLKAGKISIKQFIRMEKNMEKKVDNLRVETFPTREQMGRVAAEDVRTAIEELLSTQEEVSIIFAAAPSQRDLYKGLLELDIPWQRINALHMDEYIGITDDQPQSFRNYLKENL